jgi:hypothetical protein
MRTAPAGASSAAATRGRDRKIRENPILKIPKIGNRKREISEEHAGAREAAGETQVIAAVY